MRNKSEKINKIMKNENKKREKEKIRLPKRLRGERLSQTALTALLAALSNSSLPVSLLNVPSLIIINYHHH